MEAHVFSRESRCKGFEHFMKWRDLERSGCLKDDRFTVRCDITTSFKWIETESTDGGGAAAPARVVVPPSNLHEHLNDLMWKKQGTDVVIDVAGETFDAHGWLLAARSPVFEAELLTATKEKAAGGARRRMEIKDMEPEVFEAMLHFVYTDVLPDMVEYKTVPMAQGLLAAAHRYKLERLKLMCEEMLCKRIDVNTVAANLAAAEEHGCHALKAACLEFIARPGNMKAVMETEGFEKNKDSCLAVMMEHVMKKLA
ncbi:BTB/POZ and MATH domain-containing protein 1 [Dichanthelium oligosanthes]|uniref:BTB/POZ and MATH domain-containing protein 1 n=1 Tax=Dichanthelium oligosanthes TaxID=888268 RepID=A0A1E5WKW6_9POAL|nr:BTB/POZ and MATH domain-containing protein 1 [Dichanthelium oligosanthes]